MHFDIEHLSLSVLRTVQAFEKYNKEISSSENKNACVVQLLEIYLVQFVLDDNSPYPSQVREHSLDVLRERMERKENVVLGDIANDPQSVSRKMSEICNELAGRLKSVERLIANVDQLENIEKSWKVFARVAEIMHTENTNLLSQLQQQLGYAISSQDPQFTRFSNGVTVGYNAISRRVRSGLISGEELSEVYNTSQQTFAEDVKRLFENATKKAENKGLVTEDFKAQTFIKIDKLLQQYIDHTTSVIDLCALKYDENGNFEPMDKTDLSDFRQRLIASQLKRASKTTKDQVDRSFQEKKQ